MFLKGLFPRVIKSLPNDKIVDQSKFKSFGDDKINVTQNLTFLSGSEENIVVTSIFFFSHNVFKSCLLQDRHCAVKY